MTTECDAKWIGRHDIYSRAVKPLDHICIKTGPHKLHVCDCGDTELDNKVKHTGGIDEQ
jgi:hypothetical protein